MDSLIKKIISSVMALCMISTIIFTSFPADKISASEIECPVQPFNISEAIKKRNISAPINISEIVKNRNIVEPTIYSSYDSSAEHIDMDFSDLNAIYEHYNSDVFSSNCQIVKLQCESNMDFETILSELVMLDDEISYVGDLFYVSLMIYYTDLQNSSYSYEYNYTYNTYISMFDEFNNLIKSIAENDNYYSLLTEAIGQKKVDFYINYINTPDDTSEYQTESNKLLDEYYQMYSDGASEEEFAELYLEMVDLNNTYAQSLGYDNYIELSYDDYLRDYTTDDAVMFFDSIAEYISPVYSEIYSLYISDENYSSFRNLSYTFDEIIEAVGGYVDDISPEMAEAYDYMKNHHTYSAEYQTANNSRMSGALTSYFQYFGTPYIFVTMDGNTNDVDTLVHEFGHYNEAYQTGIMGNSIDTSEIASQAFELLFMPYYSQIYGEEYTDISEKKAVSNILWGITSGSMVADFEMQVYQNPDMTASEVTELFNQLENKYIGRNSSLAISKIIHIFEVPGYYISYAVSGAASCEIWNTSISDRQQAVSDYIDVTKYASTIGIKETLSGAGMNDVFENETIQQIAQTIKSNYLTADEPDYDVNNDGTVSSYDALVVLMIVVGNDVSDVLTDKSLADVDGDGQVSSADALMILQKTVGL